MRSSPGMMAVGGFLFDFEPFRTASRSFCGATGETSRTASATRSSSSSRPRARLPTATAHWLRGLACVVRSFRSSRAPGSQPSEPTAGAAPFYGSQGCPSLACAAGFVKGGSCARVLVVSLPLVPCLPPQLAFCYDKDIMLGTCKPCPACRRCLPVVARVAALPCPTPARPCRKWRCLHRAARE